MSEQPSQRPPAWLLGLLAFIYVPVILAFAASYWMFEDREDLIQRVTGLEWPSGTSQIYLVDEEKPEDNPYYIEAHVRLPLDEVSHILDDPRWVSAKASAMSELPEAHRLPPGLQAPTTEVLWVAQGDQTGSHPYTLVLEEQTGQLWMRVDVR